MGMKFSVRIIRTAADNMSGTAMGVRARLPGRVLFGAPDPAEAPLHGPFLGVDDGCCEGGTAKQTGSLNDALAMPVGMRLEHLARLNHAMPVLVAGFARRDEVRGRVVQPVAVNVVGLQPTAGLLHTRLPGDGFAAPMARMGAGTDGLVQHKPMNRDAALTVGKRVAGEVAGTVIHSLLHASIVHRNEV